MNWFDRYSRIGVTDDLPHHVAQQVRMLNVLVLVALVSALLSLTVGLLESSFAGIPVNLSFALLLGGVVWLQSRGKHFQAAMAICGLAMVATSAQVLMVGATSGIHHWFVPMMLLPLVIVPPGHERSATCLAVAMGLVYICLVGFIWTGGGQTVVSFQAQVLAALSILFMGVALRRSTERATRQTISQAKEIVIQNRAVIDLNRRLADSLTHVRDVSRLKEEFVASMSHELRSPLNAVMGLSEALQENIYGPLTEDQRRSLATIEQSGRNLLNLFDDLLDFARIGAGRLPTQVSPVSLGGLAQIEVRRVTRRAEERDIRISLVISAEDDVVYTDARHVRRIFSNLLSNAVKFTPKGGRVGVEVQETRDLEVLQISVWDTGPGINEEKLPLLFDPFVQIDGGLARRYGGTGLGLALTSRLTRLLGGRVDVVSEKGQGSRFTLSLRRTGPMRARVYADLNCPFCFTLNEWIEGSCQTHLVDWRGIEHLPELTADVAQSESVCADLLEELKRLETRSGGVSVSNPGFRPNTLLALAVLRRLAAQQPLQEAEARRKLFRALWVDGVDISKKEVIQQVLDDFGIGDLSDLTEEISQVRGETTAWREAGGDHLPSLQGADSDATYVGLGERGALLNFLDEQARPLPVPLTPFDSEMATRDLVQEMVRLKEELETLRST